MPLPTDPHIPPAATPLIDPVLRRPVGVWIAIGRVSWSLLAMVCATAGFGRASEPVPDSVSRDRVVGEILPFFNTYCLDCHSGDGAEAGIDFDSYSDSLRIDSDYERWDKVRRALLEQQMPPADELQPDEDELLDVLAAIQLELDAFDCGSADHPGRVTIRRLNRAEYDNTIRDLVGLDLNLSKDFPSDDVGNGFDNMGDVLSISPILMEKYIAAAQRVAAAVFADPALRDRILIDQGETTEERIAAARSNIARFARRAFRRPLDAEEVDRLFELMTLAWEQDQTADEIFQTAMTAILASPHFLFRSEADPAPDDEDGIRELNSHELATRLSYFLWSSMPDEELFEYADRGELADPTVLAAQARRMLHDPKARALTENFAGQWLQLRDVARFDPDPASFPEFDEELRFAMQRETELLFEAIVQENRSVLDFLTADFTHVNRRLANHYRLEGVTGDDFQRVELGDRRRGVLTHAGILMLTSNPSRTSPVKRGKWILDNILGEPPPPPPPDVPELEEGAETFGSLRERMQQHRSNPSCAVCHIKMDALGFGLENFDVVGGWRDQDGRFAIDASGALPGGKSFDSPADLMQILADEKKTEFCRCLASKLLTYAIGRGLSPHDRCTVDEIVRQLDADNYRFETLVTAVVTGDPFRLREGQQP